MKVVFARSILKKENIKEEKEELIKAYSKGIFAIIKGYSLPKNSQLIKLYIHSKRAVFLVDTKSKDGFFLFYRTKKDPIGRNITIKNTKFKERLTYYLLLLKEDIKNNNLEEISLG
ncbi:MAG: hypothetical protein V1679_00975 [Candidatus Peregrinibacteria bacterium]